MREIVRALARYSPTGARYWRARVWYRRGLVALTGYIYLLYLYLIGATLWAFWNDGVSQFTLVTDSVLILMFLLITLMPTLFTLNMIATSLFQSTAEHLRVAALAGDDQIALVVDLFTDEAPDSDESITLEGQQRIEVFHHAIALEDIDNLGYAIPLVAFGLLFIVAGRYDWPLIIRSVFSASM